MLPPHRLYYLHNFQRALDWVQARYDDLLDDTERVFLTQFAALPEASRALLVRLLGRKGEVFRSDKLVYDEIGDVAVAAAPLLAQGWLTSDPLLDVDALLRLYTKNELAALVAGVRRKQDMRAALLADHPEPLRHGQWRPQASEAVWRVEVHAVCQRLRLMFFGNLRQQWDEQVLADLGVFQYESVPFPADARAFQTREDVSQYLQLFAWAEQLQADGPSAALIDAVLACVPGNPWLGQRRAKLLWRLGQACERAADWGAAERAYAASSYRGARHRRLRVLERRADYAQAHAQVLAALRQPEDESEQQRLVRMLPRLCRQLGLPRPAAPAAHARLEVRLRLPRPATPMPVELVARAALVQSGAQVFYVENGLITALFGLLCWEAVFAPLPGAFFHPFQRGPADLNAPDFVQRRAPLFAACLAQLDDGRYQDTIRRRYLEKQGLQSPFVGWEGLPQDLLGLALDCIRARDLRSLFERLLDNLAAHRSGLPDLIRFWPAERRYELIEIKGPGDRLQDNQIGWLGHCARHGIAAQVCHVDWDDTCA